MIKRLFDELREGSLANGFYNPFLKVATKDSSGRKIFEYICNLVGKDNDRLRKLNGETRPILGILKTELDVLKQQGYEII